MGKRSDFARIERDVYDTPAAAVAPLLGHLPPFFTYVEPCAGDGALIGHLPGACVFASDIAPRAPGLHTVDALTLNTHAIKPDYIITNPPWRRDLLHPMIERFSDLAPTWLLFDADWIHTRQAAPFLWRLRKIVSVGRVKWFADSPYSGEDNCAWHLFDARGTGPAEFFGGAA